MSLDDKEIISARRAAVGIVATCLISIFGGNYINKAQELGSFSEADKYIKQEIKKEYQELINSRPVYHWGYWIKTFLNKPLKIFNNKNKNLG